MLLPQETEIENLKQKLRHYNDYDEIKRELEIMKVSRMIAWPSIN